VVAGKSDLGTINREKKILTIGGTGEKGVINQKGNRRKGGGGGQK